MSNQLYPKCKESLLKGEIDLEDGDIKAILTETSYNSTHSVLSDVTARATSGNLTSKTLTNGTFDSADTVYTSVAVGAAVPYVILYQDSGAAATSNLIAHIDTASGLPVTPDGSDITLEINTSGWFTL